MEELLAEIKVVAPHLIHTTLNPNGIEEESIDIVEVLLYLLKSKSNKWFK